MAGRHTKKTPETVDALLQALAIGHTRRDACQLAGINEDTIILWIKKDSEFSEQVKKAELVAKDQCIKLVRKAATTQWQAAAWYLERKHHAEFGLKHEIRGDETGEPIKIMILKPVIEAGAKEAKKLTEGDRPVIEITKPKEVPAASDGGETGHHPTA